MIVAVAASISVGGGWVWGAAFIIGGLAAVAAVVSSGCRSPPLIRRQIESQWNTMYTVPIGVRTTCYHPDGTIRCSSLGRMATAGNVLDYPAPPQMAGSLRSTRPCRECRLRRRQPNDSHDLCWRRGPREDELMFRGDGRVVALAAAGSVAWGATQA